MPNYLQTSFRIVCLGLATVLLLMGKIEAKEVHTATCESITNGNFLFGANGWNYWDGNGASGSFNVVNEEAVISISNGGPGTFDVRLRQFGFIFENGKSYLIIFKAKASSPRTIEVRTRLTMSPWTNYHTEVVNLSTSFNTYSIPWTMNEATDLDGRISFLFGTNNADVTLDDISLQEVGCTTVQVDHPTILGDTSQYAVLRSKSNQFPFLQMKNQAISDANSNTWLSSQYFGSGGDYTRHCLRTKDIVNACAIGYLLDPSNKSFYVNKATNQLLDALNYLIPNRPSSDWSGNVPLGAAIFNAILAMDIMYNDMSTADRTTIENQIDLLTNSLSNSWAPSQQSIKGVWALYTGNLTIFNQMVQQHDAELFKMFSPDGVFYPGAGYAEARLLSDDRNQKHLFLDILEHRGTNNYYTHPKLVKGHEWVWGYSATPIGLSFPFGDTAPTSTVSRWTSKAASYRAIKFGQKHMEYSNQLLKYDTPKPNIILYFIVAPNTYDPSPKSQGPSKIFKDGGAWFRESVFEENMLSGALWNVKSFSGHTHFETNAISLSAFGELLLTNSGYNGWANGQESYSWADINARAVSGNTVLIDYPLSNTTNGNFPSTNNHVEKTGAGIVEGLTTNRLDYACGDAGNALPNGQHQRNFLFIHPDGNIEGYWILLDAISTSGTNSTGHIALHPYSNVVTTVAADKEYRWTINQFGATDSYLSIHLGHQPDNLQLLEGVSADWDGGVVHDYLYATYNLGASGQREIITLLFPHQSAGNSPTTTRLNATNYTGMSADLGNNVEDYTLESATPGQLITIDDHSFAGEMSTFRTTSGNADWYFVKNGTSFSSGNTSFETAAPVSIFMDGATGQVYAATSTTIDLSISQMNMGCVQVLLNGQLISSSLNNGKISFSVPAGTHDIEVQERCLELDLAVLLEGAFDLSNLTMSDSLKKLNLLPLTDPYSGNFFADPSLFLQPSISLVDWIWVELRDKNDPASVIDAQAGLLLKDGSVVNPNGQLLKFAAANDDYYIFVDHRNHLAILSPMTVPFVAGQTTSFDFSIQNSYLGGGTGQRNLGSGRWSMYVGDPAPDINGYDINGEDKLLWSTQNGLFLQYLEGDYNMDGEVTGEDNLLFYLNLGLFSGIPK